MDMFSSINFQIIIDLVFFVTIVLLLHHLNKNISKKPPVVDVSLIHELRKILMESHESTNQFLESIEESKQVLNKLFIQLDDKEKKLTALVGEADTFIKKMNITKSESEPASLENKYDHVIEMVQRGLSRDEVSRRSGFTEAEVNLIVELARTRTDHSS